MQNELVTTFKYMMKQNITIWDCARSYVTETTLKFPIKSLLAFALCISSEDIFPDFK